MDLDSDIPQPPPVERPALEPPQFSLATLLWAIAALAALFGLMAAIGPLGGFALLLLALALVAHVAGNSLGTRLRSFGNAQVEDSNPQRTSADVTELRRAAVPASNLSLHGRVSRTMLVFTIAGAAIVGSTGSAMLIWLVWNQLNIATTTVAIISPTVLGGLIGFAISSFTQTAGGAWREASSSYQRERLRRIQDMSDAAKSARSVARPTSPRAQSLDRV